MPNAVERRPLAGRCAGCQPVEAAALPDKARVLKAARELLAY